MERGEGIPERARNPIALDFNYSGNGASSVWVIAEKQP